MFDGDVETLFIMVVFDWTESMDRLSYALEAMW